MANFIPTEIKGLVVIEPSIFEDDRGYFFESFNQKEFEEKIGPISFVQDNQSFSQYGVLRGLHYQLEPSAQAKLVSVPMGTVLDVAVDIRKGSPTYGKHFAIELSSENKKQLFIPRGFAHGFVVLSKEAIFAYKCDNFYHRESESGIRYDDPALGINWILPAEDLIISEKDIQLKTLSEAVNNFTYHD